jgi:prevent-host-death family protein
MATTVASENLSPDVGSLLDKAQRGEAITITRNGVAVARLEPVSPASPLTVQQRRESIQEWMQARKGIRLGDDLTIRELIDEGRR